jgi:hypothetical protein
MRRIRSGQNIQRMPESQSRSLTGAESELGVMPYAEAGLIRGSDLECYSWSYPDLGRFFEAPGNTLSDPPSK